MSKRSSSLSVVMVFDAVVEPFGEQLIRRLVGRGLDETKNLLDFVGFKNMGAQ
jgi:hypothetical protein